MMRRKWTCAMLLVAACARSHAPVGLVGVWRLVSYERPDSSGRSLPVWGDRPSGLIVYTADGRVAAQLYDPRRPRVGVRWDSAAADLARAEYAGLVTYYGTYSVDPAAHTVTHAVEAAMAPDWVGRRLVRAYRFVGRDRVELRVVTDNSLAVWQRVGSAPR